MRSMDFWPEVQSTLGSFTFVSLSRTAVIYGALMQKKSCGVPESQRWSNCPKNARNAMDD